MTENEEDKTLEELEAEYKAELLRKVESLREENEASESVNTSLDPDGASSSQGGTSDKGDLQTFYTGFMKKHNIRGRREYSEQGLLGFAMADDDTGCEDVITDWAPADVYCDLILQYSYCIADLPQVCVKACDINAGEGLKTQIKLVGQREVETELGACECMTCDENTWTSYTIQIDRYGSYNVLCGLDMFSVGDSLKEQLFVAMGLSFAEAVDAEIWAQLVGATPGYTETSAASLICASSMAEGSCCTFAANLYKSIVDLEAQMRQGRTRPDYLIVSPTIAKYLKYAEGTQVPNYITSDIVVKDGKLLKIGNLKVIEFCGASQCTSTGSSYGADEGVAAIMIDSTRAIGMSYGKQPLFEERRIGECDSLRCTFNAYLGIDLMDLNCIGHILQP